MAAADGLSSGTRSVSGIQYIATSPAMSDFAQASFRFVLRLRIALVKVRFFPTGLGRGVLLPGYGYFHDGDERGDDYGCNIFGMRVLYSCRHTPVLSAFAGRKVARPWIVLGSRDRS
jgi:hypothetical protein